VPCNGLPVRKVVADLKSRQTLCSVPNLGGVKAATGPPSQGLALYNVEIEDGWKFLRLVGERAPHPAQEPEARASGKVDSILARAAKKSKVRATSSIKRASNKDSRKEANPRLSPGRDRGDLVDFSNIRPGRLEAS
jgi:hypothetical protein